MPRIEIEFPKLIVLVIDDQDYVRSIIVQLLKRLGVGRVLECSNGAEALGLLEQNKPDLILCDIKMAPVDGLQFLRDVRGGLGGNDPDVPIIFLTSASDRGTVQAAIESEVDGYLVKPVSADDLKSKISTVLNRRFVAKGQHWG
jgi:two-component system chemotaxis response regulator CheY